MFSHKILQYKIFCFWVYCVNKKWRLQLCRIISMLEPNICLASATIHEIFLCLICLTEQYECLNNFTKYCMLDSSESRFFSLKIKMQPVSTIRRNNYQTIQSGTSCIVNEEKMLNVSLRIHSLSDCPENSLITVKILKFRTPQNLL